MQYCRKELNFISSRDPSKCRHALFTGWIIEKRFWNTMGGGGGVEGGADNVLVNLTICEDFVKIPKTHNRYLSKFPGDARHRAKPSRQVFAMSIASSSLPERF